MNIQSTENFSFKFVNRLDELAMDVEFSDDENGRLETEDESSSCAALERQNNVGLNRRWNCTAPTDEHCCSCE